MKCLRKLLETGVMKRIRNRGMKRKCGNKDSLLKRMNHSILRCFCHAERMDEGRLMKRIYREEVEGVMRRGRQRGGGEMWFGAYGTERF